jgi:hypothetical protein
VAVASSPQTHMSSRLPAATPAGTDTVTVVALAVRAVVVGVPTRAMANGHTVLMSNWSCPHFTLFGGV